jgi:steroid delta-isomerase
MSNQEHPARRAGLLSQKHVSEGNRDAWLDLFAEAAVLADPVGPSPLDPTGEGHRGKPAIAAFYDKFISMGNVSFDYPRSYACADECAFIGTVYTQIADHPERASEGVFLYRVDEEGKILSLRAFWESDRPTLESDIHPAVGRSRPPSDTPPTNGASRIGGGSS